jgi:hypothetical protein
LSTPDGEAVLAYLAEMQRWGGEKETAAKAGQLFVRDGAVRV